MANVSISGTIKEYSSAAKGVAKAQVTITDFANRRMRRSTKADDDGKYNLQIELAADTNGWMNVGVSAEKSGYWPAAFGTPTNANNVVIDLSLVKMP